MNDDPIVAEVRRIRDEHARRFGYDIHKIFADLIARSRVPDPAHPLVENAEVAAKELMAVKEESPNEGGK